MITTKPTMILTETEREALETATALMERMAEKKIREAASSPDYQNELAAAARRDYERPAIVLRALIQRGTT